MASINASTLPSMQSAKHPLKFIIVGGSLAGLMTGIVLKRLGHSVQILERNPPSTSFRSQGAGIVAQSQTLAFFKRHDRTNTQLTVTSKLRHYLDRQGGEFNMEASQQHMTSWDLLYNVLRANFDGVCDSGYCSAPQTEPNDGDVLYQMDSVVDSVEKRGDCVEVIWLNGGNGQSTSSADIVIGCDGPSSTLRAVVDPSAERTYAGYLAWRGTTSEAALSPRCYDAFVEKFTFYHSQGLQVLAYLIPGKCGTRTAGERLLNWVWYCNYEAESEELNDILTDDDGRRHRWTMPADALSRSVWNKQRAHADAVLPPQFAELVRGTEKPFVQLITDVAASRVSYIEGKLLLLGDALAGFRPHTAASTNQAAHDALLLEQLLIGNLDSEGWEQAVLRYARIVQRSGIDMGNRSQFGHHPLSG
ncbi:MAG: hypothetical protein M1828_000498 [Chrysothrix sp. TS-e1954]|nr:MAG: hypothetical protein M1828_000498 [Chrysothrix sp. TS-e1954]